MIHFIMQHGISPVNPAYYSALIPSSVNDSVPEYFRSVLHLISPIYLLILSKPETVSQKYFPMIVSQNSPILISFPSQNTNPSVILHCVRYLCLMLTSYSENNTSPSAS